MRRRFHLDTPAVLLLFCVFAACVILVLVAGARSYQGVTERDAKVLDSRTAQQYLLAKLRHQDAQGMRPWVTDMDGNRVQSGPVLQYLEDMEGTECLTALYCRDGHVYELFTLAGLAWEPGDGEYVLDAKSLSFEDTGAGIRVVMVSQYDDVYDFYVGFRTPREGGGDGEE